MAGAAAPRSEPSGEPNDARRRRASPPALLPRLLADAAWCIGHAAAVRCSCSSTFCRLHLARQRTRQTGRPRGGRMSARLADTACDRCTSGALVQRHARGECLPCVSATAADARPADLARDRPTLAKWRGVAELAGSAELAVPLPSTYSRFQRFYRCPWCLSVPRSYFEK